MGIDASTNRRLPVALATYVGWVLITLFIGRLWSDAREMSLADSISHGVGWNIALALAFLLAVKTVIGWRDLGFVKPDLMGSLKLLWLPAIYLALFLALAIILGLPPLSVALFVFLNTLIVGFSEEIMFRGVLFRGLLSRLSIWPAMITTSVLFGSVHILNVFLTGKLGEAAVQAVTAGMSGFLFMALLIRTGSIWVPIIYHALWDFGTFMVSSASSGGQIGPESNALAILVPLLLVTPNFLYALYLLRNVRQGTPVAGAAPVA